MSIDLSALMNASGIAIFGASVRDTAAGTAVLRNLEAVGYPGGIYPINPRYQEIGGRPCFPSLDAVDAQVDAAFIALPAETGVTVLEAAARHGIRAAFMNASGYGDGTDEGKALEARVRRIAADNGIAICGPNNVGLVNFHDRFAPWTASIADVCPGGIAIMAQSGSASGVLVDGLGDLGLAYVITGGNEAVVTAADYLQYLVDDSRVQTIVLFLETIRDPETFAAAAQGAARAGKRIIALKIGRSASGSAAVKAHTGGLAGDDEAYTAFFRRLGIVRVADFDELIETTKLFHAYPEPPVTPHVVAMTLSGGEAALAADLAADTGVSMPPFRPETEARIKELLPSFSQAARNPLDAFGLGWNLDIFTSMIEALVADPEIGVIVPAVDAPSPGGGDADWACDMGEYFDSIQASTDTKFVISNNAGDVGIHSRLADVLRRAGIPYLMGMRESLIALSRWCNYSGPQDAGDSSSVTLPSTTLETLTRPAANDQELFETIDAAGVPMVRSVACWSIDEAVAAAEKVGYPVVLKGVAPGVAHKARLGLVHLNLVDESAVRGAAEAVQATLRANDLPMPPAGIVVQEMLPPGNTELFVGSRRDALGTVIVVGAGGVEVETYRDVAVRLGPVTAAEARSMLGETVIGRRLLADSDSTGVEAITAAVARFSELAVGTGGSLLSLEINPLILMHDEARVVGVDVVREIA